MVERISTGIPGLDDLIEGGFPTGSVTLVSGGAGTGKTIFCSQFLWHGLENGDSCLFVTLEEEPEEVKADAEEFGWLFDDYEETGDFKIIYLNPFQDGGGFADRIVEEMNDIGANRVVVDSTSVMGMYNDNPGKIRQRLYDLVRKLRRESVTAVMTSEIPNEEEDRVSRYGVEEFVADALIVLQYVSIGQESFGNLEVRKMRRTEITKGIYETSIDDDTGLKVGDETLEMK